MDPDHSENVRIFFGKIDHAPAALDRSADCDNARDAGFGRPIKHLIEIVREIGIIEMRVSLDQHCKLKISNFKLKARPIFKSAIFNLKSAISYHSITLPAQVSPPPKTTIRT